VFTSPATVAELRGLGLPAAEVDALVQRVDSLRVESLDGAGFELRYDDLGYAAGLDRVRLEQSLLEHARRQGATVLEGHGVTALSLPTRDGEPALVTVRGPEGARVLSAATVVGADGSRSLVARAAGVARDVPLIRRAGVTGHRLDPVPRAPGAAASARLVVGGGWYCGITPVPGGRVNVGAVVRGSQLRAALGRGEAPESLHSRIVASLPEPFEAWRTAPATDPVRVSFPLGHRVTRSAGRGWLLVGDASGYIDPLSGEGIHRAFVSARFAADVLLRRPTASGLDLEAYHSRMRATFARKDTVSWLLQAFTTDRRLADYALRRLASRDALRRTFQLVLADLAPVRTALRPGFVAALLAP
jgi:menaquinone-9 beta-reductase